MSNVAQTITIIGATIALVGIVIGLQTFWISRSLDKLENAVTAIDGKLDDLKSEIVRDHGERIAKLEERLIRAR